MKIAQPFFTVKKLLIAIILLAFVLRAADIFWGIPVFDQNVHSYHPDEPKIIHGAFNFPSHIRDNKDLRYPTFYHYLLGVLSIPAKIIFKVSGWSREDYYIFIFIFARFVTILLGIGSIYLTFRLGRKFYNAKTGLLAALFAALSLYHIQSSSWATLDVPNSFFFVLTVYLTIKMYEQQSLKSYIITGISLGMLIGTKYIGITALIFIFILHFRLYTLNGEKPAGALFSKKLLVLLLSAAGVFLLTTPGIIIKSAAFVRSIDQLINKDAGRTYRTLDFTMFLDIIKNFAKAADPFITALALIGFIYPFKKRWDREIPLILTVVVYSAAFGALHARHLIAVLPLISVIAAGTVYYLYNEIRFIPKQAWMVVLILWITFAVVYNSAGIMLRTDDTRTTASHYIQETIPAGSSIAAGPIGNYQRFSWMFPYVDTGKYKMADALDKPDYIVITTFDFKRMQEALSSDKLHNYEWDPKYSMEWYKAVPPAKEVFWFYDNILNRRGNDYRYELIKTFSRNITVPVEFPPPEVRIYQRLP